VRKGKPDMVSEYHRPQNMEEALALLMRKNISTLPMGGGTFLSHHAAKNCEVVDIQLLGLNYITRDEGFYRIGAGTPLQALVESPDLSDELKKICQKEMTFNLRQMATLAGCLVCADGRSLLAVALHALDATTTWMPGDCKVHIGDWMPMRKSWSKGVLITEISIPASVKLSIEIISRTPNDQPLVCAAIGRWQSGRTRIVLGGFGESPSLVLDGNGISDGSLDSIARAAKNAYSQAGDHRASAKYRSEMAEVLVKRLIFSITESKL
jgi:CO/xanthine dehydrogenase FAD-binding subunit